MSHKRDKKRAELRAGLLEENRGLTGYGILLRQLAILDDRIRTTFPAFLRNSTGRDERGHLLSDVLQLDTETFYTIAHDFLKLAERFVDTPAAFRNEKAYKTICAIRSHFVRHAFDKIDGEKYAGFGVGQYTGPQLKAGSGNKMRDEGYLKNYAALMALLDRHEVTFDQVAKQWPGLSP